MWIQVSARSLLLCVLSAALLPVTTLAQDLCVSPTNTYTVVVDLFASELGYYTFQECPGLINPTIGVKIGTKYTFVQSDRSNWYHPLGFAYVPNMSHIGHHGNMMHGGQMSSNNGEMNMNGGQMMMESNNADETFDETSMDEGMMMDGQMQMMDEDHQTMMDLSPYVSRTGSDCTNSHTCPSPKYLKNGVYLGVEGSHDNGLEQYRSEFMHAPVHWSTAGAYSIELTFDDANFTQDIFYLCHTHQYMSGRIKLLQDDGTPVSQVDQPALGYGYDEPSTFDKTCGTFGLDPFQLPNQHCPDHFVCHDEDKGSMDEYTQCIDAMNCHMLNGMTTGVKAQSKAALFIHQMIPHHQNAVNMAKTLLKAEDWQCDDLSNTMDMDCTLEVMLREIINTQNHQIQTMLAYLKNKDFPETDNCDIAIETIRLTQEETEDENDEDTVVQAGDISWSVASFPGAFLLVLFGAHFFLFFL